MPTEADSDNDVLEGVDTNDDLLFQVDSNTTTLKSTKLPTKTKAKSLKKKLQEEFQVMKGLTSSVAQSNSRKKAKMSEGGECESFVSFMTESRKEVFEMIRRLDDGIA